MTTEPLPTDHDDHAEQQAQHRAGALTDELGARHLAYKRQLEEHLHQVQLQLITVAAAASDPSQRLPNPLPSSYRKVREAHEVYDAAAEAVRRHTAQL